MGEHQGREGMAPDEAGQVGQGWCMPGLAGLRQAFRFIPSTKGTAGGA